MQNSIWLWVAGAIVVVGIGAYIVMQQGTPVSAPTQEGIPAQEGTSDTQPVGSTPASPGQQTSLKALLTAGVAQQCSFSSTVANTSSSGTVYLASGMMRGDFDSLSNGQLVHSHMIVKDNTSYMWSDAMPQGFKMSFDAAGSGGSAQGGVDVNAQANYSCQSWTPDQSKFALPANITFMTAGQVAP